jgi:hypothetical protein
MWRFINTGFRLENILRHHNGLYYSLKLISYSLLEGFDLAIVHTIHGTIFAIGILLSPRLQSIPGLHLVSALHFFPL